MNTCLRYILLIRQIIDEDYFFLLLRFGILSFKEASIHNEGKHTVKFPYYSYSELFKSGLKQLYCQGHIFLMIPGKKLWSDSRMFTYFFYLLILKETAFMTSFLFSTVPSSNGFVYSERKQFSPQGSKSFISEQQLLTREATNLRGLPPLQVYPSLLKENR